jgi:two-component system, OmpR family, sensor histidine kinase VicK
MRNTKSRMDITFDCQAPFNVVRKPQYRDGYLDILKRGGVIRCITEITPDNIGECKELLQLVTELRHMDGMKGGISVNESEYMATTVLKEGNPLTEVIYSNSDEVVAQGQYIFDTMWKNAVSANKKIREFEEGKPTENVTKILSRSDGSLDETELGKNLSDAKEIDMVSSTEGLFMGYDFFKILTKPAHEDKNVSGYKRIIRVLVEVSKDNLELVQKYINLGTEVRHLKKEPPIYFAVTNNNMVATIEKMAFDGLAESLLYSNEVSYVNRFKSIFERLWSDSKPAEEIIEI